MTGTLAPMPGAAPQPEPPVQQAPVQIAPGLPGGPPLQQPAGLSFTPTKVSMASGVLNSMAIIGKNKSGKTWLGASASEIPALKTAGKKVLIMESEVGVASVAEDWPEAEQFVFTNAIGFERALIELLTVPHDYGVVVLDTFDKFQDYRAEFELANAGVDTRAAYGRVKKWTMDTAWALHKAPFTVIFLFHATGDKDEVTGRIQQTYALIGSAGDRLGEVFDIISYLGVEDDEHGNAQRVLQLGPKTGFITGNRFEKKLPNKMVNATMTEIIDLIRAPKAQTIPSATAATPTN